MPTLIREQRLAGIPGEVFPFFADAANLEAITPPWLHFRVRFVDHEFEPDGPDHTLMRDTIRFELPFGRLAMPLVSRDLKKIFDFRARAIESARRP